MEKPESTHPPVVTDTSTPSSNTSGSPMMSRPLPLPFRRAASMPKIEFAKSTAQTSTLPITPPNRSSSSTSLTAAPVPHRPNSGVPDVEAYRKFFAMKKEDQQELKRSRTRTPSTSDDRKAGSRKSSESGEVLRKKMKKERSPTPSVADSSKAKKQIAVLSEKKIQSAPVAESERPARISYPPSLPMSVDTGFATSTDSEPTTSPNTIILSGNTSPFVAMEDSQKPTESDLPHAPTGLIENSDGLQNGSVSSPVAEFSEQADHTEPFDIEHNSSGQGQSSPAVEQVDIQNQQVEESDTSSQDLKVTVKRGRPRKTPAKTPTKRGSKKEARILNEVTNGVDSVQRKKVAKKPRGVGKASQQRVGKKKFYESEEDVEEEQEEEVTPTKHESEKTSKFRKESVMWALRQMVRFGRNKDCDNLSSEELKTIDAWLSSGETDSKCWRADIDLNTVFPDSEDYRFCKQYLRECTLGVADKSSSRMLGNQPLDPAVPLRSSLTAPLHIPYDCISDDLLNNASEWAESRTSTVYNVREKLPRPAANQMLIDAEREMLAKGSDRPNFQGNDLNRIPIPVLNVKTKDEVYDKRFKTILNSASITLVSGIGKAVGIDEKQFCLSEISRIQPGLTMDVLVQCPQSADDNFTYKGTKSWSVSAFTDTTTVEEYHRYIKQLKRNSLKVLWAMVESDDLDKTADEIAKSMIEDQKLTGLPDPSNYWNRFGTNIDVYDSVFQSQMEELEKLPKFLLPDNEKNLLNLLDENVLGVNTVQMYAKPPGSRTPAHMENSLMASINWNIGPGSCTWFAVPYEYWGQLEELAEKHGQKYHAQNYWPDENELLQHGIPVIKFEQKADELVFVNTGCFHWVQSNGFCTNVSWNVGQPTYTQLAVSAISFTHNVDSKHRAVVAVESTFWRIAQKQLFTDDKEIYALVRSVLIRSLARVKSYFDVLESSGYEVEQASDQIRSVVWRCSVCESECFNLFMIAYFNDQDELPLAFCSRCKGKSSKALDERPFKKFLYVEPIENLKKIFDEYKPTMHPISLDDNQEPSTSTF